MRGLITFACQGATLLGTLDAATGSTGILIVSGGNEPRMGAHRGMAMLATRLAAQGHPVFRYDRRGVGDSEGTNGGWRSAAPDLAAAAATFRAEAPHITRLIAFGNCDAATTLALYGHAAGIDRIILANPWLGQDGDALPPAAAIRKHYAQGLASPATWRRLLCGGIDLTRLRAGLVKLWRSPTPPLSDTVLDAIARWGENASILLAEGDATAIAFQAAARHRRFTTRCSATASHSFASHAQVVDAAILAALNQKVVLTPSVKMRPSR
ncbi:hydrolase 1, exosortase A system-associated [Sphingomonas sp.]|uniref:hydrolase 1, exosortase A system-associated n=1 Tax=Sphingomonas sp. TaxID=28214 RepID=UPI0035B3BD01